jgi:sensor histidine kinase YesM
MTAAIAAAERDASEAKLKLLETQLEPHMLFNTLANLRALITTDPSRAVAMLDRLNSYLRATLSGSRSTAHTLGAEFDLLRDYLELMAVRMGPRLRYSLEVPASLASALVPPLLLQPLVENAIQHGLEPKLEGGTVQVRASQRPGPGPDASLQLVLEVADTGVGIDPLALQAQQASPPDASRGFGIGQVRARLTSSFGPLGMLELRPNTPAGTISVATLPLQTPP